MLTGESRKDQVLRARDLGAVSYVLKARFSTEALLSRVRAALGGEGDANKSKAG
jgi:DNA-binding response OmpR family regulator